MNFISKETSRTKPEYMNIEPAINVLAPALLVSLEAYLINAECYFSLSLDFLCLLQFSLSSYITQYAQKKCAMQN